MKVFYQSKISLILISLLVSSCTSLSSNNTFDDMFNKAQKADRQYHNPNCELGHNPRPDFLSSEYLQWSIENRNCGGFTN